MNNIMLIVIMSLIFGVITIILVNLVIIVASVRISRYKNIANAYKELWQDAEKELEQYRPREIHI